MDRSYIQGLGLTAKGKRKIFPGTQHNAYFPKPTSGDPLFTKDGTVYDTVQYCKKIVEKFNSDTKLIAPTLKRLTLNETCKAIFDFVYRYIQYELDSPTVEQLRRPARLWADRKGDCDCMSIFVSSILTNLGIPHEFRIVKMYGRNYFQHIYVIVPKPGKTDLNKRENYYVIDPVLDNYDQEAPRITEKKDYTMKPLNGMPIQFLNGVNNGNNNGTINIPRFGHEFDGLEDFNGTEEQLGYVFNRRMKAHLINTKNVIETQPAKVSRFYNAPMVAARIGELIGVWDNEQLRDAMLERLSNTEEQLLRPEFQGLGDIIHGDDDEAFFGLINEDLTGLGSLGAKKAAARRAAKGSSAPAATKKGPITRIKKATQAVKKVTSNAATKAKKATTNLKQVVKKAAKIVVKTNPLVVAARLGVLAAMKTNFGRMSMRIYWGLFPQAEALQKGVSPAYWAAANKSWNHLRRVFVDKAQGKESALRKSIISGRAAKVLKKKGMRGFEGIGNMDSVTGIDALLGFNGLGDGGVSAAASIAAASTILVPLMKIMNDNFKGKRAGQSIAENGGEEPEPSADFDSALKDVEGMNVVVDDNSEDNYNNEVADDQPVEGGITFMESTVDGLGKAIKAKKGSAPAKRITATKVAKKAANVVKKTATPGKATVNIAKKVAPKTTAKIANKAPIKKITTAVKKTASKVSPAAAKQALIKKQAAAAHKVKKTPLKTLVANLKKHPSAKGKTDAQITQQAIKLISKPDSQIAIEANAIVDKMVNENPAILNESSSNESRSSSSYSNSTEPSSPSTYSSSSSSSSSSKSYANEDSFQDKEKNKETAATNTAATTATETPTNEESVAEEKKSGNGGLIIGGLVGLTALALLMKSSGNKKKENAAKPVSGVGKTSRKKSTITIKVK